MLLIIAAIFAILWLFGFVVFHVTASAIHILLVIGIIALVVHLLRGSRAGMGGGRPLIP